jgi:hypothetical protein
MLLSQKLSMKRTEKKGKKEKRRAKARRTRRSPPSALPFLRPHVWLAKTFLRRLVFAVADVVFIFAQVCHCAYRTGDIAECTQRTDIPAEVQVGSAWAGLLILQADPEVTANFIRQVLLLLSNACPVVTSGVVRKALTQLLGKVCKLAKSELFCRALDSPGWLFTSPPFYVYILADSLNVPSAIAESLIPDLKSGNSNATQDALQIIQSVLPPSACIIIFQATHGKSGREFSRTIPSCWYCKRDSFNRQSMCRLFFSCCDLFKKREFPSKPAEVATATVPEVEVFLVLQDSY